jgi:opacity protein-like surface antigen
MKKLFIFALAVLLVATLQAAASARTMEVNVNKGYSFSLSRVDFDVNSYYITGEFGVTNDFLIKMSYSTEDSGKQPAFTSLGLRYEFIENLACTFDYAKGDNLNQFTLGIRGKYVLSEPLALVTSAYYIRLPDYDESCYQLNSQVEYALNQMITTNMGIAYLKTEYSDYTTYLAGVEFHPNEQISYWLDYRREQDEDDDEFGAGIEFRF